MGPPSPSPRLSDLLTLVLNTSPAPCHPSVALLEETVASLWHHAPALRACRLLLVADGTKSPGDSYRLKAGRVTSEVLGRYRAYLARVAHLQHRPGSPLYGSELLVLAEHHGCAHALRRGLLCTTTPLVLVLQHDRPLLGAPPLDDLLAAFDQPDVSYIALPTVASVGYQAKMVSRGWPAALFTPRACGAGQLVPLAALLDSTHLARVAWYRSQVFGRMRPVDLPRGAFVEDTYGQAQLAAVRAGGALALAAFGTYMLARDAPLVSHLDGHDGYAGRPDWSKWRHSQSHTPEEELARAEEVAGGALPPPPASSLLTGFLEPACCADNARMEDRATQQE